MKINRIITILEDRSGHVRGFRFRRCSDGASVEADVGSLISDGNIRSALGRDENGWRDDYTVMTTTVKERDLKGLPYSGCSPDDIRKFVFSKIDADPEVKDSASLADPAHAWAAIRKADGKEYICWAGGLACMAEEAKQKAESIDKTMPAWAQANPVQRIARVKIVEVQS